MKRSEINKAIVRARIVANQNKIHLPDFAYWSLVEWKQRLPGLDNLRETGLGWDVTDFGRGDFARCGAVLFTLRNGNKGNPWLGTPYAEKIIFQTHRLQQEIPLHFHTEKTEDIINRGGGILMLELYNSLSDGDLDTRMPVQVRMDGIDHTLQAGAVVAVDPGNSITLTPGLYHRFWAKENAGDLVVGEVSSINDDRTDNTFLKNAARFSGIEEDEQPLCPLCNEYDRYLQPQAQTAIL